HGVGGSASCGVGRRLVGWTNVSFAHHERCVMPLRGLGYLGLASPDLAPWRAFASELIGLAPVSTSATQLRFRMDVRAWRGAGDPRARSRTALPAPGASRAR